MPEQHNDASNTGAAGENATGEPTDPATGDPATGDPTTGDRATADRIGGERDDAVRHADGMAVRREVLGEAHVDRAIAGTTSFTADFQDFITRYAWGEVWHSDSIDRRTRSMLTLALLAGLGNEGEFGMHVRAALRNGVTREEIREVLMHVAVYAGVPRANSAFSIANTILAESE